MAVFLTDLDPRPISGLSLLSNMLGTLSWQPAPLPPASPVLGVAWDAVLDFSALMNWMSFPSGFGPLARVDGMIDAFCIEPFSLEHLVVAPSVLAFPKAIKLLLDGLGKDIVECLVRELDAVWLCPPKVSPRALLWSRASFAPACKSIGVAASHLRPRPPSPRPRGLIFSCSETTSVSIPTQKALELYGKKNTLSGPHWQ